MSKEIWTENLIPIVHDEYSIAHYLAKYKDRLYDIYTPFNFQRESIETVIDFFSEKIREWLINSINQMWSLKPDVDQDIIKYSSMIFPDLKERENILRGINVCNLIPRTYKKYALFSLRKAIEMSSGWVRYTFCYLNKKHNIFTKEDWIKYINNISRVFLKPKNYKFIEKIEKNYTNIYVSFPSPNDTDIYYNKPYIKLLQMIYGEKNPIPAFDYKKLLKDLIDHVSLNGKIVFLNDPYQMQKIYGLMFHNNGFDYRKFMNRYQWEKVKLVNQDYKILRNPYSV